MGKKHPKLGQWLATAICGNNILSSTLYVSGITILFSGVYAPIVLLIIPLVILFYKAIYTEVVEALPINGGIYNCLLNGTSKSIAAMGGTITILLYMATAVISAKISIEYLNTLLSVPIIPATILILAVCALFVIHGVRDSARVSFVIFIFHAITLISFILFGYLWLLHHHAFYVSNFFETQAIFQTQGIVQALFIAFAASLLGVSGFESSANYIEEQKQGVFRKTLRNMLIGITVFNPLIAFIILGIAPISAISEQKEFLLASQASFIGGPLFQKIVVIDAFLVLAGAVITSFIAVSGLIYRMASDACLPEFLTRKSRRGVYPRIIFLFFLLCVSILYVTKGDLFSLAGLYTVAFLLVMTAYSLGNLILRETRTELKRTYHAPFLFVLLGLLATTIGLVGNLTIDSMNFFYFSLYFIPLAFVVLAIVFQDLSIKMLLHLTRHISPLHRFFEHYFKDITDGEIVAFVNHVNRLHEILRYIDRNETVWNITLVHCKNWDNDPDYERRHEIKAVLPYLQKAGVFPHFNIKLMYVNKPFGPEAVNEVSKELRVRKNRILIGSIHHFHEFDYEDLGGVRIIF